MRKTVTSSVGFAATFSVWRRLLDMPINYNLKVQKQAGDGAYHPLFI